MELKVLLSCWILTLSLFVFVTEAYDPLTRQLAEELDIVIASVE